MNKESVQPYLWMLLGCVVFALMGALAHTAGERCDWQIIAIARSVVPLVVATTLALAGGVRLVFWWPGILWVRSIVGSISLICTFYALPRLPIGDVYALTNIFPIWVAVLSWPLLGEAPPPSVWLAVVCGVLGVVLIQQPHFAEGNRATLSALAASFLSAVAMIGLHRLKGLDVRAIVAHFSGVSVAFAVASLFLFERTKPLPALDDGGLLLMLLGVGLCATVGQLCLTKAFAAGAPAKVSVVGLTQIVFGLLLDVLTLGNVPQPLTLLGIALVIAPTAWVLTHRPPRVPEEAVRPPAEGQEAEEPT